MSEKKHIICYSGGHGSALCAVEVTRKYGKENVILLNHNINPRYEDEDIKRFKREVAEFLGLTITYANYGGIEDENEIPSQFDIAIKKQGFKAVSGSEFCTYELKTKPFYNYLKENFPDKNCIVYYGFDANEFHRVERRKTILNDIEIMSDFPLALWTDTNWESFRSYLAEAALKSAKGNNIEFNGIDVDVIIKIERYVDGSKLNRTIQSILELGINPPNTYSVWKHANCKGCLKAGKQHWYCVYVHARSIFEEAKNAESVIGHSIISEGVWLKELEKDFEKMLAAGLPANENIPEGKFWKSARRYTAKGLVDMFPCECWSA